MLQSVPNVDEFPTLTCAAGRTVAALLPGSSLTGGVGLTAILLFVALAQMPRPSSRACRGLVSPGWCWQLSPEPHLPVYTPHGWPKLRAHVMQQPQPGSRTLSAQSLGKGLHKRRAAASHGSHLMTVSTAPDLLVNEARTKVMQSARKQESMVASWSMWCCQSVGGALWWVFPGQLLSHLLKATGQNISIYRPQ